MNKLLPTRADLLDGCFAVVLVLLGIYGFHNAYGGTTYLLLGVTGLVVGLLLAHFTSKARVPALLVLVLGIVAALLLGGVALSHTAVAGVLPSLDTVKALFTVSIRGWKQLLTTVKPVSDTGDLLALPYLLGLASGLWSFGLAKRVRPVWAPIVPPALVVALSILLGTPQPSASVLQGAVFAVVALAWVATRSGRDRVTLSRSNRRLFRPVAGALVLTLSGLAAWQVAPHVPGSSHTERRVLHVVPPFDPGAFTSPLSSFRNYTKNSPHSLVDLPILTTKGLSTKSTVRLATLDAYDGLVWGASNRAADGSVIPGFARIGSQIPNKVTGSTHQVTITVGKAYTQQVWLPTTGQPTRLELGGPRRNDVANSLRFNVATSTGILPIGLQAGDTETLTVKDDEMLTVEQIAMAQPAGAPTLDSTAFGPLQATATKFSGAATVPLARVIEIGKTLVLKGAYTDGQNGVASFPGHSVGRLATFVAGKQIVGDDEQYASAMALMANAVGVPARVVLLASPDASGAVLGGTVTAGVELDLAGHGWVRFPTAAYTPDRKKLPQQQPKEIPPRVPPKVVPPPLRPLLSATSSTTDADTSAGRKALIGSGFHLPAWLTKVMRWLLPPLLIVLAAMAVVLVLKSRRRTRRRTTGPLAMRVAAGWRELLDTVRDVGHPVARHTTRREQARALPDLQLEPLARGADAVVFGREEPVEAHVAAYWDEVDAARKALLSQLPRVKRLRAQLSLRSLLRDIAPTRTRMGTAP